MALRRKISQMKKKKQKKLMNTRITNANRTAGFKHSQNTISQEHRYGTCLTRRRGKKKLITRVTLRFSAPPETRYRCWRNARRKHLARGRGRKRRRERQEMAMIVGIEKMAGNMVRGGTITHEWRGGRGGVILGWFRGSGDKHRVRKW